MVSFKIARYSDRISLLIKKENNAIFLTLHTENTKVIYEDYQIRVFFLKVEEGEVRLMLRYRIKCNTWPYFPTLRGIIFFGQS